MISQSTPEFRASDASSNKKLRPVDLSIVVPTYNEKANIALLLKKVQIALVDLRWELIFVDDDSPDETADEVRRLAQEDPRARVIQRIRRRGLSSACIE